MLYWDIFKSPIGDMILVMNSDFEVVEISFHADKYTGKHVLEKNKRRESLFKDLKEQLKQYFDGKRKDFRLEFHLEGTAFQKMVWNALLDIPYGITESYGSIASRIGNPRAYRAVGTAVGKNRIDIVIPCHRVVKSSGDIGNYGGGVDRKFFLLRLEGAI